MGRRASILSQSKKCSEIQKREKKAAIHRSVCEERKMPADTCHCRISNGEEECGLHSYWRRMEPHNVSECEKAAGIHIEEIQID